MQVKFFCFLGLNADGPKAKSLQPLTFSRLLCIVKRKLPVGWFPNGQQTPGKAEKAGPSAGREHICGYGGIGRRAGFRFQWATVWVRPPLPVPKRQRNLRVPLPFLFLSALQNRAEKLRPICSTAKPNPSSPVPGLPGPWRKGRCNRRYSTAPGRWHLHLCPPGREYTPKRNPAL